MAKMEKQYFWFSYPVSYYEKTEKAFVLRERFPIQMLVEELTSLAKQHPEAEAEVDIANGKHVISVYRLEKAGPKPDFSWLKLEEYHRAQVEYKRFLNKRVMKHMCSEYDGLLEDEPDTSEPRILYIDSPNYSEETERLWVERVHKPIHEARKSQI